MARTPELILGPFYPADRVAPRTSDLTMAANAANRAAGVPMFVELCILDDGGHPREGVRTEFWQANAAGRYRHELDHGPAPLDPVFEGFGSQVSDAHGRVSFTTVRPGAYRTALGETRAPHIHFQLTDGACRLVTQMFFAGEPLNGEDRWLQCCHDAGLLVASANGSARAGIAAFSWRIVLPHRTPAPAFSRTITERQP